MNMRKKISIKVSLGGVIAAISLLLMLVAGVTTSLVYAIPMITGAFLMVLVIEFGARFAALEYIAISIISMLLLGNKEAAIMYVAFFGYYPIIKSFIEKISNKTVTWIVKYLLFNISMVASYFIVSKIFMITFDDLEDFGKYAMLVLLLIGNILFVLYDIMLTRLVTIYIYRWQKYVKRMFR
ncbi:MAG: hypothetical protein IKV25_03215 [Clostridia bacterium]|nr:hypothetical protein [Clostridia bacterium]